MDVRVSVHIRSRVDAQPEKFELRDSVVGEKRKIGGLMLEVEFCWLVERVAYLRFVRKL